MRFRVPLLIRRSLVRAQVEEPENIPELSSFVQKPASFNDLRVFSCPKPS